MKPIYIIGAGGFGKEIQWLLERVNSQRSTWSVVGYLDDNISVGTCIHQIPIIGGIDYLNNISENVSAICAVGSSLVRKNIVNRICSQYVEFPTIVDPSVIISSSVKLGKGNIICAGSILTVDIELGDFVLVNKACTIGHDTRIRSFTTLHPNVVLSGNVLIDECVEIGSGTRVIQNKIIKRNVILGAGAVVVNDIPEKCTAVGVPARPIKFHEENVLGLEMDVSSVIT